MRLDVLEELVKARKPKGLANWKKLEHLSEKLEGKHSSHITFTTSYPGQEGAKKYLGSSFGNLHFLLGYVNPAFHVAPYHWQLVDPHMTDEEAASQKHPANPRYWKDAGLEMEDEGDLDEGKPHPSANKGRKARARRASKKSDAAQVQSGYGKYVAVPAEGRIYSLTNGHVYDWRVVRESYFASTNKDVAKKMDASYEEGPGELEKSVLEKLPRKIGSFDGFVYPLVKSFFPAPGSVIPVGDKYALVKSSSLEFYNREGSRIRVRVFDRDYEEFDLLKGGDIHPSILLNFATKYLKIDKSDLQQFVHDPDDLPRFAKGLPSPGFEDIGAYERDVVIEGATVRVVPKEIA